MAPSHEGSCSICQSATNKKCPRCKLDSAPLTFYCSKECQTADYTNHRRICLARQQLFRGANVLKKAFLEFREKAFDLEIYDVKKAGDELHFCVPPPSSDMAGPLYPFPSHLISNQADKEALLSYSACTDALRYLFLLMQKVLQGITNATVPSEEIAFMVSMSNLKVHRHSDGETEDEDVLLHQVLVVTLRNNERYVIDLAGAQHRQYQTIMPWNTYAARINHIQSRNPFGFEAQRDANAEAIRLSGQTTGILSRGNLDTRIYVVHGRLAKVLYDMGVTGWQDYAKKTVTKMLGGSEGDFETDMKELLLSIEAALDTQLDMWKKEGGPKYTAFTPKEWAQFQNQHGS